MTRIVITLMLACSLYAESARERELAAENARLESEMRRLSQQHGSDLARIKACQASVPTEQTKIDLANAATKMERVSIESSATAKNSAVTVEKTEKSAILLERDSQDRKFRFWIIVFLFVSMIATMFLISFLLSRQIKAHHKEGTEILREARKQK